MVNILGKDIRDYLEFLETRGKLKRVKTKVSPILEIPEILRRVMQKKNYAVLFENIEGYDNFRIAGNIFVDLDTLKKYLNIEKLEDIGKRLVEPVTTPPPLTLGEKIKSLPELVSLSKYLPRKTTKAGFKQNLLEGTEASFSKIPAFKVWPEDGGRYLTYPLVTFRDPMKKIMNMSVYRVMIQNDKEAIVHWQAHKRGTQAQQDATTLGEQVLPAAIVIGSDPGTLLTGAMPVPYPMDKQLFAGLVRGEGLEVFELPNKVLVPSNAEIVLEGHIYLNDLRKEGPYGDHFGYYDSPTRLFPVFKLERIWHRDSPIYYGSVTGKPPLEDVVIGKFAERVFLPSIKMLFPEIIDIDLPEYGMFQGIGIVSIKKRFPGHGKKVLLGLMGIGQLALTKIMVVVDEDINVHDYNEVLWAISSHVDPQRDVLIVPGTHTDELDPATPIPAFGSKLGIDATRKFPEEYGGKSWPKEVKVDEKTKNLVDSRWKEYGLE